MLAAMHLQLWRSCLQTRQRSGARGYCKSSVTSHRWSVYALEIWLAQRGAKAAVQSVADSDECRACMLRCFGRHLMMLQQSKQKRVSTDTYGNNDLLDHRRQSLSAQQSP